MANLADQLSRLVYSTDQGRLCPGCRQAIDQCACAENAEKERLGQLDGIVRVRREVSGRKGKPVTTVSGVPIVEAELKALLKTLKRSCGSGGSLKDGVIEIQGDHREKVRGILEKSGYTVRMSGG